MAKTLRLHTLAKELGIPSKVIIDKCKAEGIELKNHMAAIPLGLGESIREWFSAGADVTSVEVADPVDLEKLPKRRTKKAKDAAGEAEHPAAPKAPEESAGEEIAEPLIEPVVESPTPVIPPPPAEPVAPPPPPVIPLVSEPPLVVESPEPIVLTPPAAPPAPPSIAAKAPEPPPAPPPAAPARPAPTPRGVPHVPPMPTEPVRPAGPQLVPKPAELRGPRVVRIEAPERIAPPRPRPIGPSFGGPTTLERPDAARGRPRGRAGGRTAAEEEEARRAGTSKSPRRHGSAQDVVEQVREWRDQDLLERKERLASATGHGLRDRRIAERRRQTSAPAAPAARKTVVEISTPIVLKDFCSAIGVSMTALLPKLIEHTGKPMNINQSIDADVAEMLALDFGITVKIAQKKTELELLEAEFAARERKNIKPRPPVVAMLGHVDHGKTSLLDAIRKTNVAAGEAGGITQHIGAYRIDRGDWHVTFLDTPGHEAFTAMRARGANLTDVVVLVVAADDGVMPQTVEAINHAKAAGVTIVVALNKIDLPGADINRIYAQLSEQGLVPSEWGGTTDVIKTSAIKGVGIDELLAHLSTLSELMDLKADPTVPALGQVIEARMREGLGVAAQVLVREGTLKRGQVIVCGPGFGKVRQMLDDKGRSLTEATPGTPVTVIGLDELPEAGDKLFVLSDLRRAQEIALEVKQQRRERSLQAVGKPRGLEALLTVGQGEEAPELPVIVRADVQGSIDALRPKLAEFSAEGKKARLNVLHAGVGAITEADVRLAQASKAIIIGFNVVAEERARQLADQVGVEIRPYRIIYDLFDDIRKALEGLLAPVKRQELRGKVEVRQVFNISRVGTIAGCFVADGVVARTHRVRLVRDGRIVLENAALASLKRFKDDAREVRAGFECGIKIQDFDDLKPGDVIETYEEVEDAQKL